MAPRTRASLIVALVALALLAQDPLAASGLATSSRQYLKIPFGVRPAALAGSFVGLADDHNAVHWNPAGLVQVLEPELDLMYLSYFADMNFFYGACAWPTNGFGDYGASVIYGWMEPFNSTADESAEKGTCSDLVGTVAGGHRMGPLAVGMGGKYIYSSLMNRTSMGFGVDRP